MKKSLNLIRDLETILNPLDQGVTEEIITRPLSPKARKFLYDLADSRGYLYEKVEASTESKSLLACICGTPYGSGNIDWDEFTIEPHCRNTSCPEYGYMSNQVATIDISVAKRNGYARLTSVDIQLYTLRVWKPKK